MQLSSRKARLHDVVTGLRFIAHYQEHGVYPYMSSVHPVIFRGCRHVYGIVPPSRIVGMLVHCNLTNLSLLTEYPQGLTKKWKESNADCRFAKIIFIAQNIAGCKIRGFLHAYFSSGTRVLAAERRLSNLRVTATAATSSRSDLSEKTADIHVPSPWYNYSASSSHPPRSYFHRRLEH
jgi:hypothetical protein